MFILGAALGGAALGVEFFSTVLAGTTTFLGGATTGLGLIFPSSKSFWYLVCIAMLDSSWCGRSLRTPHLV